VESPLLQFGQVRDELRGHLALAARQGLDGGLQRSVAQLDGMMTLMADSYHAR
jgi:hypothetical protein